MSLKPGLKPISISVAPNGGRRVKADHSALPLSPSELAATAAECLEFGAAMIHVHVRDRSGRHLLDADAYRSAIAAIRAVVGDRMVIQITSEALDIYRPAEQMAVVREVCPQAVSLALRELVPDESAEPAFAEFLIWLKKMAVAPQIILYSPAEAARLHEYTQRGLIPWKNVPVLLVLGRYSVEQTSLPIDLLPFLAPDVPRFEHWSVCAFGRHEAACVTAAALLGGNVRVGFENNLLLPDGSMASSNGDLVETVAKTFQASGIELQTGAEMAADMAALSDQ